MNKKGNYYIKNIMLLAVIFAILFGAVYFSNSIYAENKQEEVIIEHSVDSLEEKKENLRAGDSFTVTVKTNHPVTISKAELTDMGKYYKVSCKSEENGMVWKVKYTLGEYPKEKNELTYKIEVQDGNEIHTANSDTGFHYYPPFKITDIKMESDNVNSSSLAKDGDKIRVSFTVSQQIQNYECSMKMTESESLLLTQDEENPLRYTAEYEVKNDAEFDNKGIEFYLKAEDIAGNQSKISKKEITYYSSIEESLKELKLFSSNQNERYVKNGENIIISYKTGHPVKVEEMTIADKEVDIRSRNRGCEWTGNLAVMESMLQDNQTVTYRFKVTDDAGNTFTYNGEEYNNGEDKVTYFAPISIKNFKMYSDNKENSKLAKNGNEITISFTTTHPLLTDGSCVCMSAGRKIKFKEKSGDIYRYTAKYTVSHDEKFENKKLALKLVLNDMADNEEVVRYEDRVRYYTPIPASFKEIRCISSNKNAGYAMNGDIITLTYESTHPVKVKNMTIAGREVRCYSSSNKRKWQGKVKITEGMLEDNQIIGYRFDVEDEAGNAQVAYSEKGNQIVQYMAPIEIENLSFKTENENKNLAKTNDSVTVSFHTTHRVNLKESRIKMSENHDMKIIKNGVEKRGVYEYEAAFQIGEDREYDNKRIGFFISVGDDVGNLEVTIDENRIADSILYYSPIEMSVSGKDFYSTGTSKDAARDGNKLMVSFQAKHPVTAEGMIAGKKAHFETKDGGYSWNGFVVTDGGTLADNAQISYAVNVWDSAGNSMYSFTEKDTKPVCYFAPITINDLSVNSDNQSGNTRIAKNGDTITIRFSTGHPVYIRDSVIAGQKVEFVSEDNMNWCGIYQINEKDMQNMSPVSFQVLVGDVAQNEEVMLCETNPPVIYYAPIQVYDLKIRTDNKKASDKCAKDEDTVIVEFATNHKVEISEADIAGYGVQTVEEKQAENEYRWKMTYTIKNGDLPDMAVIGYGFLLKDEPGNEPVRITKRAGQSEDTITYYAPITAVTAFSADNTDRTYIKNGDTVIVECNASHPVSVTDALIAGRAPTVSGDNTNNLKMSYTIPANEGAIPEGNLFFEYRAEDAAGNELQVNSVSDSAVIKNMIYDRTLPKVEIFTDAADETGYFSKDIKYSITYTGTNIYEEGLSCKVNGVESINSCIRQPIEDGYKIELELSHEENYRIEAACTDRAGNKNADNTSIAVTIDKTNPKLNIVEVDTGHIFNSEFVLADYLKIEEENLKDVDCILTDNQGSHDWDIKDAITGDGKKTVTLKMTDMAGNVSDTYVYEFYVDVTPPYAVVVEEDTGYLLKKGHENRKFHSKASFHISLEGINVGQEPDKFTSVKILDENGKECMDVLKSGKQYEDGSYQADIEGAGNYTIMTQAIDSVGNDSGICRYEFTIEQKTSNRQILYIGLAVAAAVFVIGFAVIKKKRK